MDVYSQYIEELTEDTKIDEMSLKEKALFLPGIKAKWVARIITHKNNLNKLEKRKPKLLEAFINKIKEEAPLRLHSSIAKDKAEAMPEIQEINLKITEEKNIIEFLEKVEKIFSSMSFDISNIVKIIQLETT
jgi:hypothetical protein